MRVVALVSGGKDSCFSIFKCRSYGHKVVALAHIAPPDASDEPDSLMYQSVGSSAVRYIADALQLPLYIARTSARAVLTTMAYTPTPNDEVEDLVRLLQLVKESHPDVQAVCAGALWSDYQRLRVESAASRSGLLSLAYLWRREQSVLLDEMIQWGMHAVLVKVAGMGLGKEHLGKSLKEMRPTLTKLAEKYGSHVCGEGGEFESFVLWMPGFHKRIVLDRVEVVLHSNDTVAPVSFLKIVKCHLEGPTAEQLAAPASMKPVVPDPFFPLWNPPQPGRQKGETDVFAGKNDEACGHFEEISIGDSANFMHVCVRSLLQGRNGVVEICERLETALKERSEELGCVLYVTLHLRSVTGEKYKQANDGYTQVFGTAGCTPPPSRTCVGAHESNYPTIMEALVRKGRDRASPQSFTLHVQSLSEWAPPCIGPYAQFVEEDGIIHLCGVLPLYAPLATVPENMPVRRQVKACALNFSRTLEASRSKVDHLGLFVAYVTTPCVVEDVYNEMEESLLHEKCIAVVVPAAELPKGASVEIRAVGTLNGDDLYFPSIPPQVLSMIGETGVNCETIVCGNLAFVALTVPHQDAPLEATHYVDLIASALSAINFECSSSPLSLQVYIAKDGPCNLAAKLTNRFPACANNILRSNWMPRQTFLTCIATLALQSG